MISGVTQEERRAILDGLSSSDGEVRRLSVEQLPRLEIEEAVPHLAERLGDEVWRVRKAAVEQLVRCVDHVFVQELLIEALADGDDPGRRNSAFEALVACGARVTPRLIAEIENPDVDVRKLVIDALAAIADPEARPPLVAALQDPDTNVRAAAAEALGMVGGPDQVDVLLEAVQTQDEDLLVRLSALRALVRLEAEVSVGALEAAREHAALRPPVLRLLGISADPRATEVLLKSLTDRTASGREAAMAALLQRLGRLDDPEADRLRDQIRSAVRASAEVVDRACDRLESADLASRLVLIQFLGLLDEARVVIPILRAGRDDAIDEIAEATLAGLGSIVPDALDAGWDELDAELRQHACFLFGRLRGDAAERRLVDAIDADDAELRCAAATALGEGLFVERLPDLLRRLEAVARNPPIDSDEEIRTLMESIVAMAEGAESLENAPDTPLIETLVGRLSGASEPMRLAIARVLARLGRPCDEQVVGYLLKDESPEVRRAAVQALARFDFERVRDSLRLALGDESESVRTAAASVLGETRDVAAIGELERMTHDEDPRVVATAMRALGRLCQQAAPTEAAGDATDLDSGVERAQAILAKGLDASPIVALSSLEALETMGGPLAASLALSVVTRPEPEVIRLAIACIDAHGSDEDLAHLLALVPHADWSVRADAAEVLARRGYRKALPALLRRLELEDDAFVRESILGAIRGLEA